MTEKYQIIDEDEKVIHEGTEEEMQVAYMVMAWDKKSLNHMFQESRLAKLEEKYPKAGKIKMIKHVVEQTTTTEPASADSATDTRLADEGHRPDDGGKEADLGRDQGHESIGEQSGR